jgi:transposase-like protein
MKFRRMVVERMKGCDNITVLAKELGLERKLMYTWRDQLDPEARDERPAIETREEKLEREVRRLKRVLADKTLEVDFFKGALQKVAARRQQQDVTGAKASTTKSGK